MITIKQFFTTDTFKQFFTTLTFKRFFLIYCAILIFYGIMKDSKSNDGTLRILFRNFALPFYILLLIIQQIFLLILTAFYYMFLYLSKCFDYLIKKWTKIEQAKKKQ